MTVLLVSGIGLASADVLLIEEVRERMLRDLPTNGLTQVQVEQRYGRPAERRAPVGDPPITRWIYDDYSVYFEYDIVIESVLHRGAVLSRSAADGN
ncbi:MAG: hypothetical protein CVV18_06435 [Gammaproteobacteria bacterium HGW-Gammaproteobacteria-8]|nr:MAG: hypothetical protein CVV18_06435 [Gammaproteobacteria bacterium HGW-Gammaproteobacteria-8]